MWFNKSIFEISEVYFSTDSYYFQVFPYKILTPITEDKLTISKTEMMHYNIKEIYRRKIKQVMAKKQK